jgi:RHS repeat-associated protein
MDSTASCWIKYQYDARGNLYKEIRKFASDTNSYITEYQYDLNGNLDTLIYPTGRKVAYNYDDADNIIQVRLYSGGEWTTIADSVKYAPFGQAESWILGNGIKISLGIDSSYRQDSISTLPDSIVRLKYSYDAVDNISQIENYFDTLADRNFTYDDIYRLTEAKSSDYPDTLIKYIYADNGNREKVISYTNAGIDTAIYSYTGNKLITAYGADSMAFSYDTLGNVIQIITNDDTMTFQYNDAGMLTGVDSGNTGTYYYDARYRRIKKVVGGSTVTKFIPNEFGQVLTEYAETAEWERDYIYLNGQPIARVSSQQGEGIQYVITDNLGTPVALVDEDKTIRWKAQWYPFGEFYDELVSSTNDIRFSGQWEDDETGLYYNWHRYYGPTTGRYYQPDPIGLDGRAALYLYGGANPVGNIDPFGLYSWSEFGYDLAQAAVGFGDDISFGITRWIRSTEWYGGDRFTDECSGSYKIGEWLGVIVSSFGGTSIGRGISLARMARYTKYGSRAAGIEFSHWIPVRYFEKVGLKRYAGQTIWNGNYVSRYTHSWHDPLRYGIKNMVKPPKWTFPFQQWSRVPLPYKGLIIGFSYGYYGVERNK